jgi:acetyltransferase-like isoleucine patch superfamily enzyme
MRAILKKLKGKNFKDILFFLNKKSSWMIQKYRFGSFGKNSVFQKPLIIYNKKRIFISNNVTIRPGIRIEPIKRYGSQTFSPEIVIGEGTNIEQCCHITSANKVIIGEKVTIAGFSMITDIDHDYMEIGKGILQQDLLVKSTEIGDESFIGMGARIMPGVHIGKHCIIGANCVVTRDIPDYSVAVGIPAKIIKKYNIITNKWERV